MIRASHAVRSLFRVSRVAAWSILVSWTGVALAFASPIAAQTQGVAAPAPSREAPHWAVQVAAFYKPENVAEGAERLKKEGFPVVTEEYTPRVGKPVTLLLAGPYPERQAAEAAAAKLHGLGWSGSVLRYTPSPSAALGAAAPASASRPAETKAQTPPRPSPAPPSPPAVARAAEPTPVSRPAETEAQAPPRPSPAPPSSSAVDEAPEPTPALRPAETEAQAPPRPPPDPAAPEPAASERVAADVLVVAKAPPPIPAEAPAPPRPPEGDSIPKRTLAPAQSVPYGRVALFGNVTQLTRTDLSKSTLSQWSAALTLHSASNLDGGVEYAVDYRGSQYIASSRDNLNSLYNAYVGARTPGGAFGVRIGQMWLDELGSLGSVGGVYLSLAQRNPTSIGRFRLGLFGGVEPKVQQIGYFDKVRKAGAFVALDGYDALRSVLGYVQVRNDKLLERSVIVLNNYIPIGRTISVYQAGEYDIAPPAGQGKSGLNYFLVNARWQASRIIEVQALYHYGLSIDARTLTDDQIHGRPIDPRLLDGFLFESVGGRLTFTVTPTVRLYAGYAAEKRNRSDATIGRITAGLFASNLFNSGFDLSVSENRYQRTTGQGDDNAVYASLGRSIGTRIYLTAEYSTSVAFLQFTDAGGVTVVSQPSFQRYGLSGVANLSRAFSLLLTLEHITGDRKEDEESRALLGLSYRF